MTWILKAVILVLLGLIVTGVIAYGQVLLRWEYVEPFDAYQLERRGTPIATWAAVEATPERTLQSTPPVTPGIAQRPLPTGLATPGEPDLRLRGRVGNQWSDPSNEYVWPTVTATPSAAVATVTSSVTPTETFTLRPIASATASAIVTSTSTSLPTPLPPIILEIQVLNALGRRVLVRLLPTAMPTPTRTGVPTATLRPTRTPMP